MKKLILLGIVCLGAFCFSWNVFAKENAPVTISKVKQNGATIEFTVASDKKFRIGNNLHILHIGTSDFSLSKQSQENGKSTLTFLIPATNFNSLIENDDVWMSYGNKFKGETPTKKEIETLAASEPNGCWYLGKFTKALLSK